MKKILSFLLMIALSFSALTQEDNSSISSNPGDTIDLENFDKELVSKLVFKEMNMLMDSLNLEGFVKNDFLEVIAKDHAAEMVEEKRASTKSSGSKKDISSRIQYYGGSGIGDELVMRYNVKKNTDTYHTYKSLARAIIVRWTSSTRTMRKLRKQKFFLVGVGSKMGQRKRKVYVAFMMGNYYTENKGAEEVDYLDPKVTGDGIFPLWKWGMDNYEYRPCRKCKRYFPDLVDLQKGLSITDEGEILFEFNDLDRFERLIRRKKDGLAVDIVRKSQFDNCGETNIVDYTLVNRGIMTKPLYTKKLYKRNKAEPEGKRNRVKKLKVILGEFPEELDPDETELNLIVLQKKYVCYNIPPTFTHNPDFEYSQKISLLPDTTVPEGVPAYKPEAKKNTLEFRIPFERNKYDYKMEDIQPVMEALNEPKFIINKVHVSAYSSLEGSEKANKKLQEKRAESIVTALKENQNKSLIDSVSSDANWEDFKDDVKDTEYSKIANMTKEEAIEHIRKERLAKKLEPILKNHRYADVKIWITYDISGENEEDYVIKEFNDAIKNKKLAKALSIQKYMFEELAKGKYGKKAVDDMQIPDGEKYTGLNMNKICMKKIAYDDVIDKEYQEKIMGLWEKDRENPYIYHNRLYTEVLLSDITDEYVREELQEEIDYLYDFRINKKRIDLLNIEMQYKLMSTFADSLGNDHPVVENSLEIIKEIINFDEVNWKNSLKLASIYMNHHDYNYAYQLLSPFATKEDVHPELLLSYISLCSKVDDKIHSPRFYKALKMAKEMDKNKFCNLFDGDKSFSVQVFANTKVKELYCKTCNK